MLTSLGLVLLLGMALGALAKRLKLPSLVGMLIAGMILGPYALNLLSDSLLNISADLRQLALIIILTRAGLSLDVEALKRVGRPAILMCFVPACFEILDAEGYGNAQSAEQNPSHPSEMVESEGKEYSYKENGNKRTLQSFFYNGCLHTRCKITDYFRHFVTFSYFLYKKQRLSGY